MFDLVTLEPELLAKILAKLIFALKCFTIILNRTPFNLMIILQKNPHASLRVPLRKSLTNFLSGKHVSLPNDKITVIE
jgi:hypothetical protein